MSASDRWARVRTVLEELVGRPADERMAYVAAHIDEPEIRREVESLLRAHDDAGNFLEAPSVGRDAASTFVSAAILQPGTKLGAFEILEPVGAGGMGQVYSARDTRLDRTVAVKIIAPDLAHAPDSRERFEREARAISKLTHPHICVLHDVGIADLGEHGERQFLVMELAEGQTLRERLDAGALPLHQALRYSIQIADALAAAHSQQIVHRDLKPANIALTKSGVKLLDFGLASFRQANSTRAESDRVGGMGLVAGTLPYMCPEQLEGKNADARGDIFSFGAVLYEMVTGRKAFEAESRASVICSRPYRALPTRHPDTALPGRSGRDLPREGSGQPVVGHE